jgi:hypothetical protein
MGSCFADKSRPDGRGIVHNAKAADHPGSVPADARGWRVAAGAQPANGPLWIDGRRAFDSRRPLLPWLQIGHAGAVPRWRRESAMVRLRSRVVIRVQARSAMSSRHPRDRHRPPSLAVWRKANTATVNLGLWTNPLLTAGTSQPDTEHCGADKPHF